MAPLLKLLCTFVMAILVITSTGDSLGAAAARPVLLHGAADTEASLGEHGGRRLAVSPWSKDNNAGASSRTHDPNNHH
jgi:hypothetical protein